MVDVFNRILCFESVPLIPIINFADTDKAEVRLWSTYLAELAMLNTPTTIINRVDTRAKVTPDLLTKALFHTYCAYFSGTDLMTAGEDLLMYATFLSNSLAYSNTILNLPVSSTVSIIGVSNAKVNGDLLTYARSMGFVRTYGGFSGELRIVARSLSYAGTRGKISLELLTPSKGHFLNYASGKSILQISISSKFHSVSVASGRMAMDAHINATVKVLTALRGQLEQILITRATTYLSSRASAPVTPELITPAMSHMLASLHGSTYAELLIRTYSTAITTTNSQTTLDLYLRAMAHILTRNKIGTNMELHTPVDIRWNEVLFGRVHLTTPLFLESIFKSIVRLKTEVTLYVEPVENVEALLFGTSDFSVSVISAVSAELTLSGDSDFIVDMSVDQNVITRQRHLFDDNPWDF